MIITKTNFTVIRINITVVSVCKYIICLFKNNLCKKNYKINIRYFELQLYGMYTFCVHLVAKAETVYAESYWH